MDYTSETNYVFDDGAWFPQCESFVGCALHTAENEQLKVGPKLASFSPGPAEVSFSGRPYAPTQVA